jgi:hypothetical protein
MSDSPALQTLGGAAAGTAIGYAVAGRSGGVVGALLGGVLGYNIGPFGELVVGATRGEVRRAEPILRSAGSGNRDARDSAAVAPKPDLSPTSAALLEVTQRGWIAQFGYDPNAEIVASRNGDPFGSVRIRRSLEWELIRPEWENALIEVMKYVTLGVVALTEKTRKDAIKRAITDVPFFIIFNPDFPPAIWSKNGPAHCATDLEIERMRKLYGPSDDAIYSAYKSGEYVANVAGKAVKLRRSDQGWIEGQPPKGSEYGNCPDYPYRIWYKPESVNV